MSALSAKTVPWVVPHVAVGIFLFDDPIEGLCPIRRDDGLRGIRAMAAPGGGFDAGVIAARETHTGFRIPNAWSCRVRTPISINRRTERFVMGSLGAIDSSVLQRIDNVYASSASSGVFQQVSFWFLESLKNI